jgi:hypothetical protein
MEEYENIENYDQEVELDERFGNKEVSQSEHSDYNSALSAAKRVHNSLMKAGYRLHPRSEPIHQTKKFTAHNNVSDIPGVTYQKTGKDGMKHEVSMHGTVNTNTDKHYITTKKVDTSSKNPKSSRLPEEVEDLDEGSAADTLKPGGGSGGTESKAEMLATFTSLLAQLGKEDLSSIFNAVQAQYGPNNAPGAVDNSAQNASTLNMKPSAAVGTGAWKEDIDDMFGDDLTEEFREKAETIFEAAVNTRINLEVARLEEELETITTDLEEQFNEALEEKSAEIFEDLSEKLDQYLDYAIEQWMEENQLAVENSLRADIAEDFISGLQNLFAEHYITVPDEKIDLVAEMKAELEELKTKLNETIDTKLELENVLNEAVIAATLDDVSTGLVETQIDKFRTLAEGIEFTDADTYRRKLEIIKENYFSGKKRVSTSTGLITEEIDGTDDSLTESVPAHMQQYMQAISKTISK